MPYLQTGLSLAYRLLQRGRFSQTKGAPKRPLNCNRGTVGQRLLDQRLENWNERRALALPYFLRSTTRGSRVRNPPRLRTGRRSGSKLVSALEMPWRTAPAWPDRPPPDTVHTTSY